jgi:hypothetical protein
MGPARHVSGTLLLGLILLGAQPSVAQLSQTVISGPVGSGSFGETVAFLPNGNYVVVSPGWNQFPVGDVHTIGAATFCNGTSGCQGAVTLANSFTGRSLFGNTLGAGALSNGNYVVGSTLWNDGALDGVAAIALCSGTTGCVGTFDSANSLVGSSANDGVGLGHPLPSGDYLVVSSGFDDGGTANVGAITLCSGTSGCAGPITTSNSLLGVAADDFVGSSGVTVFADGRVVVQSGSADNGSIVDAGAITFLEANAAAPVGRIDSTNTVFGSVAGELSSVSSLVYDPARERFAVGSTHSSRVLIVDVPEPGIPLALVLGSGALGRLGLRRKSRTDFG